MSLLENELEALKNIRDFGNVFAEEVFVLDVSYSGRIALVEMDAGWAAVNAREPHIPTGNYSLVIVDRQKNFRDVAKRIRQDPRKVVFAFMMEDAIKVRAIMDKDENGEYVEASFSYAKQITRV